MVGRKKEFPLLYALGLAVVLIVALVATGVFKLPVGQILSGGRYSGPFILPAPGGIPLTVPYGIVLYGSDFGQITSDTVITCNKMKGTYYVSIKDQANTYYDFNGQPITQTCPVSNFPCASSGKFDLESACIEGRQTVINFNDFVPLSNGTYEFSSLFMSDSLNTPVFNVGSRYTTGAMQVNCPPNMIPSGQGYCFTPGGMPGSIVIATNPSGALVSLDGNLIRNADGSYSNGGITPLTLNVVPIGNHRLHFTLAGYYDQDAFVDVAAAQASNINVNLVSTNVPSPTPAVNPPLIPAGKAAIYFDAFPKSDILFYSQGLQTSTPKLINNLTPGTYQYKFKTAGYPDFYDTITVQADQYYTVYRNFLTPTPVPNYAVLTFQSTPSGQVMLGSQQAHTPYTFSLLTPGTYSYTYQLVNYSTAAGTITVEAGKSYTVSHTFTKYGQPTPTLQPVPMVCPIGTVCGLDGQTYSSKCVALTTCGGIQGEGACPMIANVSSTPIATASPTIPPNPTLTPTPSPTASASPTPVPIIEGTSNNAIWGIVIIAVVALAVYYGFGNKGKKRR
jgi:hypothetical protein